MRLQSALSMDEFQGIEDDDFGRLSREERDERRDERSSRQRRRKRKRRKRKTARLSHRRDKHEPKRGRRSGGGGRRRTGGSGPKRPRKTTGRGGDQRSMVPARRHEEATRPEYEEAALEPAAWGPEAMAPEILDADFEDDFQEFLDLEMGAARRRRWSPKVKMGPNFRIQAAQGYRAAVIELKPGLFIVAEVPEHVARSEFGFLPLLAPLVVRAVSRAIAKPPEQRILPKLLKVVRQRQGDGQRQGGGQGRALLQRMFQKKAAAAPKQIAMRPAPVPAQRQMVPAPGAGHGQTSLMPMPMLGRWVDDDDLADLFGCDEHGNCDCGG